MKNVLSEKPNKTFFSLLKSGVTGEKLSEPVKLGEEELRSLYILGSRHNLSGLLSFALTLNGFEINFGSPFFDDKLRYVAQYERQKTDVEDLKKLFSVNNIEYIILKGSEISKFYFFPETRYSVDVDVLIKKEKFASAIKLLKRNGYKLYKKTAKDVLFTFPSGGALELHFKVESDDKFNLTQKIWAEKEKTGKLSTETVLCYLTLHAKRHFFMGGCGLKYITDVVAILNKNKIDDMTLDNKLNSVGAESFYDYVLRLIDFWFNGKEVDDDVRLFGDIIISGGTFGNYSTSSIIESDEYTNVFSRIFLPYEKLKKIYPSLTGKKVLTPFYQVKRWFNVFNCKKRKAFIKKTKVKLTDEEKQKIKRLKNILK